MLNGKQTSLHEFRKTRNERPVLWCTSQSIPHIDDDYLDVPTFCKRTECIENIFHLRLDMHLVFRIR